MANLHFLGLVALASLTCHREIKWLSLSFITALLSGLDGLHFALSIHATYYYLVVTKDNPIVIFTQRVLWSIKALGTVQVVLLWIIQWCEPIFLALQLERDWIFHDVFSFYLARICTLARRVLLDRKIEIPVYCAVAVIANIGLGTELSFSKYQKLS
ncbi:hypothetical protein D9757_000006 [Collybiopsis confluens]|uniref:Uncharacterized protein n=1 Tax=Collybiopsis confluens TaxID=2823264 RepID=A0A8H5I1W6_9AGAR|nr:hypothetical protein D9757_000006 [Collybiopsis confluens]